jgi:hypothetical protein
VTLWSITAWHVPPAGVIKLNSDGAIKSEAGRAASGGVARDADGFMSAWCRVYQGCPDSLTIEALALHCVMQLSLLEINIMTESLLKPIVWSWFGSGRSEGIIVRWLPLL